MDTLLKKWPCIFYFCIAFVTESVYAQNSGVRERTIYNQFPSQNQFPSFFDSVYLRTSTSSFDLGNMFVHKTFIYKRRVFFTSYQSPLHGTQVLRLRTPYNSYIHSPYTSVFKSHERYLPYKSDMHALYSEPSVWIPPHAKIARGQQAVNLLLSTATSFYTTWAQQKR